LYAHDTRRDDVPYTRVSRTEDAVIIVIGCDGVMGRYKNEPHQFTNTGANTADMTRVLDTKLDFRLSSLMLYCELTKQIYTQKLTESLSKWSLQNEKENLRSTSWSVFSSNS
jgi:hypothetical protein